MSFDLNELESEEAEEYRRLQTDPVYFYDKFFKTHDEYLYDYQKQIMWDVARPPMLNNIHFRDYVWLKGRQIGASWISGILACWAATMHDNWEIVIVSFNLEQSQRILGYTKSFMERLKPQGWYSMFIEGQRGTNLRWNSGSIINAVGCTRPEAHNIRNYHAHLLFVDEEALIYDKMFPSITPLTAHTGGKTLHLSTAGAIGSFFYRMWYDGNQAQKLRDKLAKGYDIGIDPLEIAPIKSYTIPSTECPALTPRKLASEKRRLGEVRYTREYLCIWAGTADQVFTSVPIFDVRRLPTRSKRPCFAGIDVGKVNDPTVLIIIEAFQGGMEIDNDGVKQIVDVPYRVIYTKEWERQKAQTIANDIFNNMVPRYAIKLFTVDTTGGHGDELFQKLVELDLHCRGLKVKSKSKNDMMVGINGLDDAFLNRQLWINNNINDFGAEELRFELSGYIGKLQSSGYYSFDSTVGRDHYVDSLAYAWKAVKSGSLDPLVLIRRANR